MIQSGICIDPSVPKHAQCTVLYVRHLKRVAKKTIDVRDTSELYPSALLNMTGF